MAWRSALTTDAKLAFAGDEGAGLSLGIDSAVYAEEERGREASDDSDDDTRPSTARCAPHAPCAPGGGSPKAEFWEPAPGSTRLLVDPDSGVAGGQAGKVSPQRKAASGLAAAPRPQSAHRGGASSRPRSAARVAYERSHVRPDSGGWERPATGRSVLFTDANAAVVPPDTGLWEETEAVGTGIDIALHLQPSKPGIGHTLYSDWGTQDYRPNLHRLNIVDYLVMDDGSQRPYVEDVYYESASMRAVDYWNLKRVAREIRTGKRRGDDVFCSSAKQANLLGIDALVPSRQVKLEAGARIRGILKLYTWRWRRNKAAVKMQATYRMYLTKIVTRTKRAERRQQMMDRDGREALRLEREAAKAAEARKGAQDAEAASKLQAELEAKAALDASMAEAARLQAEIFALQQTVKVEEGGEEEGGEEDVDEDVEDEEGDGDGSSGSGTGDELGDEDDGREDGEGEGRMRGGVSAKARQKAELEKMRQVFAASGMNKAEMKQMFKLYKRSLAPGAELSAMEQQKLEMIRQMMDAETKKLDKCAVLVQSFWRGLQERRVIQVEMDKMRYRTRLARDSSMVTTISRVFRGHVARRLLRYALRHKQRMERVARIVRTEGDTRKHVLNRIEAKRKQLEIAVTDVQRLFRGHLGRRRFRSRAVFQWELRLHLAAKKIQAMYRDRIDSQWASYVNKGNLQVLVGRRAARELRVLRKSQVAGTTAAKTLKPPIGRFYPKKLLAGVSIIPDGVPRRDPRFAAKLAKDSKPPPSHPHSVKIRQRWGMPHDFAALDSTSQTVVEARDKLSSLADALNDQRSSEAFFGTISEEDAPGEEDEDVQASEGSGKVGDFARVDVRAADAKPSRRSGRGEKGILEQVVRDVDASLDGLLDEGALTGTHSFRGTRPASTDAVERRHSGSGGAPAQSRPQSRGEGLAGRSPVRRADGTWDYGGAGSSLDLRGGSREASRGGRERFADASAHHWYDDDAPDTPPRVSDDEDPCEGAAGAGPMGYYPRPTPPEGATRKRQQAAEDWGPVRRLADLEDGSSVRGANPPLPPFAGAEFGTETERFHIAPGQAQIMPTYLRLQYREQAAATMAVKAKEMEGLAPSSLVPPSTGHGTSNKMSGSLLELARVRHQDYTSGRARLLPAVGVTRDFYHETDLRDPDDDVVDVELLAEGKRLNRLQRFGSLAYGTSAAELVLNLRNKKLLQTKSAKSAGMPPDMVVPRTRLEAQDLHARSSSLGPASLPSQPAAAQPGGDPAFERALGSFGFGEVPSAKFTRRKKGASVADAARADKRGGPSAGLKARAGKAGASAHAVYAKLQAHRQATAIGDGDSEDAEY